MVSVACILIIRNAVCIAVYGCPSPPRPPNSWIQREGDLVTISCNHSNHAWKLTCVNASWSGHYGNCSQEPSPGGLLSNIGFTLNYGKCYLLYQYLTQLWEYWSRMSEGYLAVSYHPTKYKLSLIFLSVNLRLQVKSVGFPKVKQNQTKGISSNAKKTFN